MVRQITEFMPHGSQHTDTLRGLPMRRFLSASCLLLVLACLTATSPASAQSLPVSVNVSGETATIVVGSASTPIADLTLTFDDASNLTAAGLGVSAQLVNPTDPSLLARLPATTLTQLDSAFPLLITIEPTLAGGLSFERTVRVEVHTHNLPYTVGSSLRLFKAPLGGQFRDISDEIAPGSVRARGTTGGFSQFLVLADLRDTDAVVAQKFAWLRAKVATVAVAERASLDGYLDAAEDSVATGDHNAALLALDSFRARVSARAGIGIAQQWRAARDLDNPAGEMLAGAATLRFSIAYLRDFGP